jgi:hypothetical protein
MDEQEQKLKFSDVTVNDVTALLKSKEAHRFAIALGLGLGTSGWGFLAAYFGFKGWDKFVAPTVQKDVESFRKLKADLKANMPNEPPAIALTPQQQKTSAWVILGGVGTFAVLVLVAAFIAAAGG